MAPHDFWANLSSDSPQTLVIMLVQSVFWFVCEQDDKHVASPKSAAQSKYVTTPSF